MDNKRIKEMVLPDGIDSIGDSAFNSCQQLQFSEIPEGVKTIGGNCFRKFDSDTSYDPLDNPRYIQTLILPSTLESIGDFAFVVYTSSSGGYYNSLASEIVCKAKIPPTLGSNAFGQYAVNVTVPKGCGEAYRTAEGWSMHTITEADE